MPKIKPLICYGELQMSLPFEAANCVSPPVKPVTRRFQVSIKGIMIATAIIAAIIGLSIAPEIAAFGLMIFHVVAISFAIIAAISGRGWIRPFAIIFGLYLVGLAFAMFTMRVHGPEEFVILELINMSVAILAGICGALFHSYLLRRGGYVPVPNLPWIRKWLVNEPSVELKDQP